MAEQIVREIWLFQKRRVPPIDIVAGSQIPIALEMKDYTIPAGATVKVYARPWGRETTYVQDAAVNGNTVVFTPQDGFFREGWNAVQLEINGSKIPLALDVNGGVRLSDGGSGATPEAVRPLVERAEAAAAKAAEDAANAVKPLVDEASAAAESAAGQAAAAKSSADAAEKSAQGIRDSAEKIDRNAEDVSQLKEDIVKQNDILGEKISAKIPNGRWREFDFPSDFLGSYKPIKVITDGHFWKTDYEKNKFKNTSDNAVTYYVSPDGKWDNRGTRESPYSLYQAVKVANDGDTIIMMDGEYRADNHQGFDELTLNKINKSINIIGEGSPKFIRGRRKTFSYDADSGLYKLVQTNAQKVLDNNGVLHPTVKTLSECKTTKGSTYSDGTNIYANIEPNLLENVLVLEYGAGFDVMPTNKSIKLYIENVGFYGGMWNIRTGSAANYSCEIVCDHCDFAYQVDAARSGAMFRSTESLLVNCNAHDAMQDGFQYTKMTDGNASFGFVEINCNGYSNGHISNDNTCNGTTSHSGICGIRINGNYYDNHGGNVADVQTNTQSVNCGCVAMNSCASDDGYKQGFGLQQAGAVMWLYDCIAVGNFYDFYGVPNTTLNAERCCHAKDNYKYDYSGTLSDENAETLEYKNLFRNLMISQSATD